MVSSKHAKKKRFSLKNVIPLGRHTQAIRVPPVRQFDLLLAALCGLKSLHLTRPAAALLVITAVATAATIAAVTTIAAAVAHA